ncbi:PH domain-containing protein [Actinokineospora sp. PR83]|uniref:PH domain-containing protein n=1 Tax=Actinokineospora sp. PR83 TaxID=2884908 RepID=UPI001F19ADB9|nr:PH domain-containing protein [Actinokineospora sp. PR83]MCG8915152.1 PH domain-containing protein [Actinokineospora sp. PR83]
MTSKWRWLVLVIALLFFLLAVAQVVAGPVGVADVVLAVLFALVGAGAGWAAVRSGVEVGPDGLVEVPFFGRRTRVAWAEVVGMEVGEGASVLPSRVPVITTVSYREDVHLSALSFYTFGTDRVPAGVRRLKTTVEERATGVGDGG